MCYVVCLLLFLFSYNLMFIYFYFFGSFLQLNLMTSLSRYWTNENGERGRKMTFLISKTSSVG